MHHHKHLNLLGLLTCALLIACTPPAKKADLDMYRLPATSPAAGRPVAIDNDSYYSQPGSYQPAGSYTGCAQINDSPSCGGG